MWILNPAATTEPQLKMMEFLGALMGMSFRSGILLDINISRFVWKQIVGTPVTIDDLNLCDEMFVKNLFEILEKGPSMTDEEFAKEYGETHTMSILLSNGKSVDLVENGSNIPVTRANITEYFDKAVKVRLEECKPQVEALINGIAKTFDKSFLRMVSWKYFEHRVVGLTEVSVERLKEITSYRNCSDSHEVIKRFWQVLESFSNEDKIAYLRFVWGRTRLPLKEEEVVENHTI